MRKPLNQNFPISQGFGDNPQNYSQFIVAYPDGSRKPMAGHNGIDYATPYGTPVVAPHNGIVIEVNYNQNGYGNYIKIENDVEGSVLAHLSRTDVMVGMTVEEGSQIGLSGNTGYVLPAPTPTDPHAGSHLHWGYYRIPRDRANGYDGYIDPTPYLSNTTYTYKYKIGDMVETATDIPVYPTLDTNTKPYGKIGVGYIAKIIGIKDNWYNIDQTGIGGGTGWVQAQALDTTPQYVRLEPQNNTSVQATPSIEQNENIQLMAEIDNLRKERDELTAKYNDLNTIYIGFKAQGYTTVDDVTKLLKQKDETITGCQTQLQQTLKRNSTLSGLLQEKENEDYTAIEEGMKAAEEAKQLKDDITKISKETGTRPNLFEILDHLWTLRETVRHALEQAKKETNSEKMATDPQVKKTVTGSIDYIMNLFGLSKGVKI